MRDWKRLVSLIDRQLASHLHLSLARGRHAASALWNSWPMAVMTLRCRDPLAAALVWSTYCTTQRAQSRSALHRCHIFACSAAAFCALSRPSVVPHAVIP
jgi:hypothetical protein